MTSCLFQTPTSLIMNSAHQTGAECFLLREGHPAAVTLAAGPFAVSNLLELRNSGYKNRYLAPVELIIPIINEWREELSYPKPLEPTKNKKLSVLKTAKQR